VFFDSHCHIDFDEFADDRIEVVGRALAQGVNGMLIPGVCPNQWPLSEVVARACREYGLTMLRAVGLHPWWIDSDYLSAFELHQQLTQCLDDDVVAIGECGLDALRDTPIEIQIDVLQQHIAVAKQHELPLVLHCVKAHETMLELLKQARLPAGGVVHGFGGSYEIAQRYWDMGFYIGVGAMATRPHASRAQRAFAELPLEAMLLETDAPAMPVWREQENWSQCRNEPANIRLVADALATIRAIPVEQVATICRGNTERLFGVSRFGNI